MIELNKHFHKPNSESWVRKSFVLSILYYFIFFSKIMYQIAYNELNWMIINLLINLKCLNFTPWNFRFEFYLLKFKGVWILYPDISKFRFYLMKFESVWILHSQILKFQFVKFQHPQTLYCVWLGDNREMENKGRKIG